LFLGNNDRSLKTMPITNDVRVEIYRSFIDDARAPVPAEIAARLGSSVDEVTASVRELADQEVVALVSGTDSLWLAHPFCALDAPFSVASGGRHWDAICIWDALGILAMLETDGRVVTRCPDCGDDLTVSVEQGAVSGPAEYLVHYGVPAARWYEDIGYT
jgi:hypothetical protein